MLVMIAKQPCFVQVKSFSSTNVKHRQRLLTHAQHTPYLSTFIQFGFENHHSLLLMCDNSLTSLDFLCQQLQKFYVQIEIQKLFKHTKIWMHGKQRKNSRKEKKKHIHTESLLLVHRNITFDRKQSFHGNRKSTFEKLT